MYNLHFLGYVGKIMDNHYLDTWVLILMKNELLARAKEQAQLLAS
jgi:hypothetical protein